MVQNLLSGAVLVYLETLEMTVDDGFVIVEQVDFLFLVFYLFLESLNAHCELAKIQDLFFHHFGFSFGARFSICGGVVLVFKEGLDGV